jgi:hypothetical protein
MGELLRTPWELDENTLGTDPKKKTTTELGLLCACCIASKLAEQNFYSSLLFVTIFNLG